MLPLSVQTGRAADFGALQFICHEQGLYPVGRALSNRLGLGQDRSKQRSGSDNQPASAR